MSNYYAAGFRGPKQQCHICGLRYYKEELTKHKGKWVCDLCLDDEREYDHPKTGGK